VSSLLVVMAAVQAMTPPPGAPVPVPFGVGERFEYSAKLGILTLGSASIQVMAIDTVRGQPAWYFRFTLDGGNFVFRINSSLESWTSVREFRSLRFRQDSKENSREYLRDYEIFADSGYYRQRQATATTPTTAEPLDDASILYFVRTAPLVVGQTYKLERHFKPEINPIVINVLKRESVDLPDGTSADCLVLNPIVGTGGLFGNRTDARLWITDDARRIPVQIKTRQPYGPITLRLDKITAGSAPPRPGSL
jgi:hypothetical protein